MNDARWVQHQSGTGSIYRVESETDWSYLVEGYEQGLPVRFIVPKTEYHACPPPPEIGGDVTRELHVSVTNALMWRDTIVAVIIQEGYRFEQTSQGTVHVRRHA